MASTIIKEYDNTTAGGTDYSNFTVVVPGFCKDRTLVDGKYYYGGKKPYTPTSSEGDQGESVFDENGVYICKSQSDFVNCIGKLPAMDVEAKAPTLVKLGTYETTAEPIYRRVLTPEEFFVTYKDQVYTFKENKKTAIGYLVDTDFIYTKATTYGNTVEYAVILKGNEGNNAESSGGQYGNQIAYKLLELGYTVLYKNIDKTVGVAQIETADFWSPLKDRLVYNIRYLTTGGYYNVNAYKQIAALALNNNKEKITDTSLVTGRGDCFALIDIDESYEGGISGTQSVIVNKIIDYVNNELTDIVNKYCAIFTPRVTYDLDDFGEDEEYNNNATMPASFHYLVCANKAFQNYAEWFAVSGYTRGISDWAIENLSFKLGDIAIRQLEPRILTSSGIKNAVNPITSIRGAYYIWGNRTAEALDTEGLRASHFLNIRQLCCTLKKDLDEKATQFKFDPNSDVLWVNFKSAISTLLENMKGNQGIEDYKVIKIADTTKGLLKAQIRIVPIEAVEDFVLEVDLEDSIAGTTVAVIEEEEA